MTSIVSDATARALLSFPYDVRSTTVGLAMVVALGILLFQREATRGLDRERSARSGWAFDVVLVPFLIVFLVIIAARLAELIP